MPGILNLKFEGNKSFVAFSNLNDAEALTQTWKVCTKVASYLEQGQRLENLSWRLWHLQSLMVDSDNAKSKREFKKLTRFMGDKLDKEKGRNIEELPVPDFKPNHSTDLIQQRAVEKEMNREASQHTQPGTIRRMQFTFPLDQSAEAVDVSTMPAPQKPDNKPLTDFVVTRQRQQQSVLSSSSLADEDDRMVVDSQSAAAFQDSLKFPSLFSNDFGPSALLHPTPTVKNSADYGEDHTDSNVYDTNDSFSIIRPTLELPLDDIINSVEGDNFWTIKVDPMLGNAQNTSPQQSSPGASSSSSGGRQQGAPLANAFSHYTPDIAMNATPSYTSPSTTTPLQPTSITGRLRSFSNASSDADSEDEGELQSFAVPSGRSSSSRKRSAPGYGHGSGHLQHHHHQLQQTAPTPTALPKTVAPSKVNAALYAANNSVPARQTTPRPHLTVRTGGSASASATASSRTPTTNEGTTVSASAGRSSTAPGGIKAECSNCGATHTPLWRRGLNDELNCNACGLYCKLHKRPRPKSMRNSHGEGRAQAAPRQETVDIMAQCYNCHTTATPLWRKDDEGRTVCNACGLYYKLHGSSRPISMKSDVIRKRSRHDARRSFGGPSDGLSASPGVSRRASPDRDDEPILAPDSSTYDDLSSAQHHQQQQHHTVQRGRSSSNAGTGEYSSNQSELLGALGHDQSNLFHSFQFPNSFQYHQFGNDSTTGGGSSSTAAHTESGSGGGGLSSNDPLPFASGQFDLTESLLKSPRVTKRRRMSTDSLSEPPSSAVSFGSFDGYSSSTSVSSAHSSSAHSSIDWGTFAYLPFQHDENTHSSSSLGGHSPPMGTHGDQGPATPLFHPPMLPPSMMDFTMSAADEENMFSMYLHPPMTIPEEGAGGLLYPMPESSGGSSHKNEYDVNMRIY